MDESVSGRVRTVISATGLSHAAFAARAGITPDKLSKSLNGVRRFSSLDLALIAEAGEVSVDWLLTGRQPAPVGLAARGDAAAHGQSLTERAERFTAAYDVLDLLDRTPELPELPELPPGDPGQQGERLARTATDRLLRLRGHLRCGLRGHRTPECRRRLRLAAGRRLPAGARPPRPPLDPAAVHPRP
jgi:hypothetical protein